MARVTELEVYDALNHTEWHDAFRVRKEIASVRNVAPDSLPLHRFYPLLRSLETEGFTQSRENYEDTERVRRRGGRPVFEYRLTEDGIRKRVELHQKEGGIEGMLSPTTG